ncbi:hypothetical protein OQA88_7879 [Cercophora sp. LCS_1]
MASSSSPPTRKQWTRKRNWRFAAISSGISVLVSTGIMFTFDYPGLPEMSPAISSSLAWNLANIFRICKNAEKRDFGPRITLFVDLLLALGIFTTGLILVMAQMTGYASSRTALYGVAANMALAEMFTTCLMIIHFVFVYTAFGEWKQRRRGGGGGEAGISAGAGQEEAGTEMHPVSGSGSVPERVEFPAAPAAVALGGRYGEELATAAPVPVLAPAPAPARASLSSDESLQKL